MPEKISNILFHLILKLSAFQFQIEVKIEVKSKKEGIIKNKIICITWYFLYFLLATFKDVLEMTKLLT